MDKVKFGHLLKEARLNARFFTRTQFLDELSRHGLVYTDEALGHWERGRSVPDRPVLLRILRLLAEQGGIFHIQDVVQLLELAGKTPLSGEELAEYFTDLSSSVSLLRIPRPDYRTLLGRDDDIAFLADKLTDPYDRQIVAITGLGGMGKTALAYEVIRETINRGTFKAVLWESLKSEEFIGTRIKRKNAAPRNWRMIWLRYAEQLGWGEADSLSTERLEEKLQESFQLDSYLIVLDNLETDETAHAFTQKLYQMVADSKSKVLLTSRERLLDLSVVYDYPLDKLSEGAAGTLLEDEAKSRGAADLLEQEGILKSVYDTTQGMPLAIKLVVTQFLLHIPVDVELARLQGVVQEQKIYEFIYRSIWQKLSVPAQQVLVGIAIFSTSAERSDLIEVSEVDEDELDDAASDLIRFSLLSVRYYMAIQQLRYEIHALTRWFVNVPLKDAWRNQSNS